MNIRPAASWPQSNTDLLFFTSWDKKTEFYSLLALPRSWFREFYVRELYFIVGCLLTSLIIKLDGVCCKARKTLIGNWEAGLCSPAYIALIQVMHSGFGGSVICPLISWTTTKIISGTSFFFFNSFEFCCVTLSNPRSSEYLLWNCQRLKDYIHSWPLWSEISDSQDCLTHGEKAHIEKPTVCLLQFFI